MDALEFLRERKRMCNAYSDSYNGCYDCPLIESYCVISSATPDEDLKKMIPAVEQWSKEHPRKTRQSVFLEQYPNVMLNTNGIIDIPPCRMDTKQHPFNGKDCCNKSCEDCNHEFWMQEVE